MIEVELKHVGIALAIGLVAGAAVMLINNFVLAPLSQKITSSLAPKPGIQLVA